MIEPCPARACRAGGLAAEVDRREVDLLHLAPGVEVGVEDRVVLGWADARVVEGDVDRAVRLLGRAEERVDVLLAHDVDAHEGAADLLGDPRAVDLVEVADDDLRALLGEPSRRGEPDARAPPGDDRDLAVEPACHVDSFPAQWICLMGSGVRSVGRDEDVLDVREGVERVGPQLAPDAALLEAAEGCRVAHAAVRVDREVAGLDTARDAQSATEVPRPDRPREAVCRVVGLGDRVGLVVEGMTATTGPKTSSCQTRSVVERGRTTVAGYQ